MFQSDHVFQGFDSKAAFFSVRINISRAGYGVGRGVCVVLLVLYNVDLTVLRVAHSARNLARVPIKA